MTVDLSTVFLGIIASLTVAALPWVYKVHGRLTHIESRLDCIITASDKIEAIEDKLHVLELAVAAKCRSEDCQFHDRKDK